MATNYESKIEVIGGEVTESGRNRRHNESVRLADPTGENTPLLAPKLSNVSIFVRIKSKFRRLTFVKSKSAILVLIWSFFFGMLQWIWSDPSSWIPPLFIFGNSVLFMVVGSVYVYLAILQLFYPLAGYLADIRFGRYKCVIGSLWCFIGSSVSFIGIGGGIGILLVVTYIFGEDGHTPWLNYTVFYATIVIFVPCVLIGTFLFFSSIVAFNANVIQFGLDQLHDSPSEHLVLYIHWFVVLSYAGTQLIKASVTPLSSTCSIIGNLWPILLSFVCFLLIATFICLFISLCVAARKRNSWFLEDTRYRNPYGLVYRVISFAREHKSPIQRSAFTYCEDELPSRLDLGKEKYGGPFTTEQVEDVKVFLGILKVLLTLGPFFAVERPNSILLPAFYAHISEPYSYDSILSYPCSLSSDVLPSVVIIILLIFYIVLLRPFVQQYVPGILKRIGLGMLLMLMPTLCFFILDIIYHKLSQNSLKCFLTDFGYPYYSSEYFSSNVLPFSESNLDEFESSFLTKMSYLLVIPQFCSISGSMIFHIAIYEFIYSQSPHSMKGLMFGTFFAIRGVFQLLGALVFLFPFFGWKLSPSSFPSCGFVYYLVTMVVALVGMIAYIYVAKKYRNRERDEPDNIYRYAEEYYSKIQNDR